MATLGLILVGLGLVVLFYVAFAGMHGTTVGSWQVPAIPYPTHQYLQPAFMLIICGVLILVGLLLSKVMMLLALIIPVVLVGIGVVGLLMDPWFKDASYVDGMAVAASPSVLYADEDSDTAGLDI